MITVEEVKKHVERIREMAGDDEGAHGTEDDLWEEVLRAISEGAKKPKQLAIEALKTTEIDFARWCA